MAKIKPYRHTERKAVMFKVFNGECFYQWTRGQKVEVAENIDKVFITTKAHDRAIEKPVYTLDGVSVADVPDGLFEQAYDIAVYGIVDGRITVNVLPVITKEKPENYGITKKEDHKWVVLDERYLAMEDITGGSGGSNVPSGGGAVVTETYPTDTLEWHGDTDGRATGFFSMEGMELTLTQISDILPTVEDLKKGGKIVGGMLQRLNQVIFTEEMIGYDESFPCVPLQVELNGYPVFVFISYADNLEMESMLSMPKKGIYVGYIPEMKPEYFTLTVNDFGGFETTEKEVFVYVNTLDEPTCYTKSFNELEKAIKDNRNVVVIDTDGVDFKKYYFQSLDVGNGSTMSFVRIEANLHGDAKDMRVHNYVLNSDGTLRHDLGVFHTN